MFFFPWSRDEAEARWIQDSWSAESPIVTQWRCVKHQGGRQSQLFCSKGASKQRRFWATHVNRKWTYSLLIFLVASKICIAKSLFYYRDDLPKNLFKIIAQECKKSTSGWRASLKMVATFWTSSINNRCSKKWEILCNAPSTENPWKLSINTNSLELSYPVT